MREFIGIESTKPSHPRGVVDNLTHLTEVLETTLEKAEELYSRLETVRVNRPTSPMEPSLKETTQSPMAGQISTLIDRGHRLHKLLSETIEELDI